MNTEAEIRERERKDGFEDGERGHEPKNAGSFQKLEKARTGFSHKASRRNQPCQHLDFSPVRLILGF